MALQSYGCEKFSFWTGIWKGKEMAEKVTPDTVEYVRKLAKLELSETEKEKMTESLSEILEYMEVLNELDTEGVEAMSHVHPLCNGMRPDEGRTDKEKKQTAEEIKQTSTLREGDFFCVPKTF